MYVFRVDYFKAKKNVYSISQHSFFSQFHLESQHSSLPHFHLQGQHTLSSVTSTLSILTNRVNTLFLFLQLTTATKMDPFCNHSLPHYTFLARLFPAKQRNFIEPQKETNSRYT